MHQVQTTFNDVNVSDIDHSALFELRCFVRHESETQITVLYPAEAELEVRKILATPGD